jgi:hypothetical protein
MLAFSHRFEKWTGIVFHNSGNTLTKLTANLVLDCTISKVKVATKGQEVLGGDIAFINMVVSLQGSCSASYPCYLCDVPLTTLKKCKRSMTADNYL